MSRLDPRLVHLWPDQKIEALPARPHSGSPDSMFLPPGTVRKLKPKEHLFREGDDRNHLYSMLTGTIALYGMLADGRRQIFRLVFPGDLIGLDGGAAETMSAVATISTSVRCMPLNAIIRAREISEGLKNFLIQALSSELSGQRAHITALCAGCATQRVAYLIDLIAQKQGLCGTQNGRILLAMTRSDMGDYLGLTIETVSRELSRLRSEGVIELDRVKYLRILDRARLKHRAMLSAPDDQAFD